MSDNSYGTIFGPFTPGVINLVSGQTNGVAKVINGAGDEVSGGSDGSLTLIGDADPLGDVCSNATRNQVTMGSTNIGDLLSAAGVTWGSFMGGFNLSTVNPNGTTGCSRSSTGLAGTTGTTSAPLVLQLLCFHCEPGTHASNIDCRNRPRRSGQPSIRPSGLLYGYRCRTPPGSQFFESTGISGWTYWLLGSFGRANLSGQYHQFSPNASHVEKHRGRDHVRRFRRLV